MIHHFGGEEYQIQSASRPERPAFCDAGKMWDKAWGISVLPLAVMQLRIAKSSELPCHKGITVTVSLSHTLALFAIIVSAKVTTSYVSMLLCNIHAVNAYSQGCHQWSVRQR